MHPNEVQLVFKTESGHILPTRERTKLLIEELDYRRLDAINVQTLRQIEMLEA